MATFRSLRHRNYRLYFFGQMVSLIGSWMQSAAVTWLAYRLTGNQSKWPAFLAAAQMAPTVLLGVWTGGLADRGSKLRLIVRTQTAFLVCAGLLAALTFAGLVDRWVLLAIMLAQGVIQAIDLPARLAFVPDLVSREDLINAVALNSVLFNVARTAGPALAGVLLAFTSPAVCFLLNAISYAAVLFALLAMHVPADTNRAAQGCVRRSPLEGFAVLRRQPRLLALVLLAGFVAVCGWPLLVLLPAFSDSLAAAGDPIALPAVAGEAASPSEALPSGARAYSAMLSAVGVGALLAGLTTATYGNESRRFRFLLGGMVLVSVALGGLSQAQDLGLAVVCCAAFGFGMILLFATGQAAVQLSISGENRGQVMAVWAMVLSGGAPVGNLLLGPAADAWGVRTVLLGQSLALGLAAVALLLWRLGRRSN